MQLNKKKILILLGLILSLTGSGKEKSVLLPIIRSSFHTENGNIRNWREDGWCRGNLKIENSSPARVSCMDKMSALLHVRRFDVTPGERIRGTFQARGYANLTFALYLYDRKGFISSAAKGVKEDFTEGKTVDFSLEVPKTLKGRSPESAFFAIELRKKSSLEMQNIAIYHKVGTDHLLKSGDLQLELNSKRSGIAALQFGKTNSAAELMHGLNFSWYSRGIWRSPGHKPDPVNVIRKTETVLQVKDGCEDFHFEKTFTLLPEPEALKVDFKMTAKYDFFIGGGDPPGGINLPIVLTSPKLTHYLQVMSDGTLKIRNRNSFRVHETGFFPEDYISGRCTPDGKNGFFFLLDNRFYRNSDQSPFIAGNALCYSRDAFRFLKKGDVITGQFYLIPFSGNAEAVAAAAVKAYCSTNPAERAMRNDRYASYRKAPPATFRLLRKTPYTTVCGGDSEIVLPQQRLPEGKESPLTLSAARNENGFAQIVIRPDKETLHALEISADTPEGCTLEINALKSVPSRYAATVSGMRGMVPDILAPLRQQDLAPGINHACLLTFGVGKNAEPGIRKGVIRLKSSGKLVTELPYELEIYNFELPRTPFYRTAFLAWTGRERSKNFHAQDYLLDQRKLRITGPVEIGTPCDAKGNLTAQQLAGIRKMVKDALDAGDTAYRFSGVFDWRCLPIREKTSAAAETAIKNYIRQIAGILREINAQSKAWMLFWDETHWSEEINNRHILWCKWVKEAAPDLPIFSTQNHPLIPLAEYADILCGSNSSTDVLKKQFGSTKEYWLYENGFYFAQGQSSLLPRGIPWRSIPGKFAGYHQWSSTHWAKDFTPGDFHGTGALYYPPEYGDGKPVRSLRLVNFSQGVCDYDYIRLLELEIARCSKSAFPDVRTAAKDADGFLRSLLADIVPDQYHFQADSLKIRNARRAIADRILQLKQYKF